MKSKPLNLCSICINNVTCILTHIKDRVWSCSEFEENNVTLASKINKSNLFLEKV